MNATRTNGFAIVITSLTCWSWRTDQNFHKRQWGQCSLDRVTTNQCQTETFSCRWSRLLMNGAVRRLLSSNRPRCVLAGVVGGYVT